MRNRFFVLTLLALFVSACSFSLSTATPVPEPTGTTVLTNPAVPSTTAIPSATPTITPTPAPLSPADEVTNVVINFGKRLQQVNLLSDDAVAQIQGQYAPFVYVDLLQTWIDDPSTAPGRRTSSPWPDHIEIVSVSEEDVNNYSVEAQIVDATSDDPDVARHDITLQLELVDGRWMIIQYFAHN